MSLCNIGNGTQSHLRAHSIQIYIFIVLSVYTIKHKLLKVTDQSKIMMFSLPVVSVPALWPGRVEQSVGHLTRKSGVLGSIPDQATYFRFSFRFFKKGSCQLLAKICALSTG